LGIAGCEGREDGDVWSQRQPPRPELHCALEGRQRKDCDELRDFDRAHRIGQVRHVMAYRVIARDTIEERVLELQASKRALADAILSADNSLFRNLKREDLELLLT
jgi:hypothetical protein